MFLSILAVQEGNEASRDTASNGKLVAGYVSLANVSIILEESNALLRKRGMGIAYPIQDCTKLTTFYIFSMLVWG